MLLVKNKLNEAYLNLYLAGDNFHGHTAVITRPNGKQMNEDKLGTKENDQSTFNDETVLNDVTISPSNSMFVFFFILIFFVFLIE